MRRCVYLALAIAAAGCSGGDDDDGGGKQSIRIYSTDLPAEGPHRGRARVPVTPGDARMHFYLQEDGRGPLRLMGSSSARPAGPRSILVTLPVTDSDPRQGDRFFSCAVGLLADGFGHPRPSDPGCGKRMLAATRRRMTAGR